MAAIDQAGITILINGDATPFKRAMREARAEGTMLSKHLQTVNKLIKFDPGSTTLLTRRQQLLGAALAQNASHLTMLQQANEAYAARAATLTEAERRQWMKVQSRISEVELEYAQLRAQAIQYGIAASAAHTRVIAGARGLQSTLAKVSTQFMTVSAAIALIGGLSLKAAVEFESSFAGVRKTIIATEAEYEELARAARDLALVKPVNVNDINYIMELGGQLNIAKRYLVDFASVMADLSVSTNLGLEDGSLNLARFMNIVNMSQADVDRLGATIVDLGNNSATTEADILNMAMRIAGSGRNIGLTAQNVLALATSLSSVGIQAEMGGNAISTIMNRIDKSVALNQSTLSTWAATAGMTTEEFKYNWENNVQDTLIAIFKGMGEYREEGNNLNVLLKDMNISYMRQVDTMQRLSRAGLLTEELFLRSNTAWANNTALVREATQRYSTAESKMTMMKNAIYETGIAIGNEILPYFSDLVVGVTDVIKAFSSMDAGTKSLIINLGGIAMTAGVVIKAVEKVAGGIGFLAEKLAQFKTWAELSAVAGRGYTNMNIEAAAAAAANAAAERNNALALAQSSAQRANSLRRSAAMAAAHGAEAYAARLSAMASRYNAQAVAASSTATSLNTAATVANASQKGILSSITTLLTAQTWSLSVALGVTNGQLLALVAGAVVIGLIGKAIYDAVNPMNQLTKATQQQKAELDDATAKYHELRDTLGESADETVKAKAAMEDLEIAYKDTSETLGEFHQRMNDTIQATKDLREESAEATQEAFTDAGRILNTADAIDRLKDANDVDSRLELSGYINDLRGQVEGLDITLADVTGNTEKFQYAMDEAQKAADKVRYENAYEQFANLNGMAVTLRESMEEMREQYSWLNDENARAVIENPGTISTSSVEYTASADYYRLMEQLEAVESDMDAQKQTMAETMDTAAGYEMAMRYAQDANVDMADALAFVSNQLGVVVDEQGLAEYKTKQATAALAQQTQEVEDLRNDLTEMLSVYPAVGEMVDQFGGGMSGLAQYLYDAGIEVKDFEKAIEDAVTAATNGYDALEAESEVSLEQMLANLQANKQYMDDFKVNMDTLYAYAEQSGNESWKAYLQTFSASSEEDAATIAAMAANPEMFAQIATAWYDASASAAQAGAAGFGVGSEAYVAAVAQTVGAMTDQVNNYTSNVQNSADGAKAHIENVFGSMQRSIASYASGFAAKITEVVNNTGKLDMSDRSYSWGYDTMSNYANGIQVGINATKKAIDDLNQYIKNNIGHSIAKEGPLHNGGRGEVEWGEHLVENFVLGMKNREDILREQVQSLALMVTDPLSSATPDWDATYTVNRAAAGRTLQAMANGQTYNVYMDGVRINDDAAVQGAVMTLIGAAQTSAAARRRS